MNPDTGEIYEGEPKRPEDVELTEAEVITLRQIAIEKRYAALEALRAEQRRHPMPAPKRPKSVLPRSLR